MNNKSKIISKENQEERFEEYLKKFDKDFKTSLNKRMQKNPLLTEFYNEFIQIYSGTTKLYKKNTKRKSKIIEELNKTLNKTQKNLLEKSEFLSLGINSELVEQAFIYGFATATQFRFEAEQEIIKCSKSEQKNANENSRQK